MAHPPGDTREGAGSLASAPDATGDADPQAVTLSLQLVLPAERARALDQLASEARLPTKDVLNHALTLLDWAVREVRGGRVIASVDDREQRIIELEMPLLQAFAAHPAKRNPEPR